MIADAPDLEVGLVRIQADLFVGVEHGDRRRIIFKAKAFRILFQPHAEIGIALPGLLGCLIQNLAVDLIPHPELQTNRIILMDPKGTHHMQGVSQCHRVFF